MYISIYVYFICVQKHTPTRTHACVHTGRIKQCLESVSEEFESEYSILSSKACPYSPNTLASKVSGSCSHAQYYVV